MIESSVAAERGSPFFQVSVTKLVVLTTLTWGFYFLVWAYLNWDRLRTESGDRFGVVTRALILPLVFNVQLFRRIRQATIEHGSPVLRAPSVLALTFAVFALFSLWRGSWWSLLQFASVVPLAVVQSRVNSLHAKLGFDSSANSAFTPVNIVACVAGATYLVFYVEPLVSWLYRVVIWKLES